MLFIWNTVNPYFRLLGRLTARETVEDAGIGGWKKRRIFGNRIDRGCGASQHHPARKGADFQRVLYCKITYRTFKGGKANDDYS